LTAKTTTVLLTCVLALACLSGCVSNDKLGPDLDGDGIEDANDGDMDGDGMHNEWERLYGLDPRSPSDNASDEDHDGLSAHEEFLYETDPTVKDSDGDGVFDGDEIMYLMDPTNATDGAADADWDGIPNWWEISRGLHPRYVHDALQDPDGDGFDRDGSGRVDIRGDIVSWYDPFRVGEDAYNTVTTDQLLAYTPDMSGLPIFLNYTHLWLSDATDQMSLYPVKLRASDDPRARWEESIRIEMDIGAPRPPDYAAFNQTTNDHMGYVRGIIRVTENDRWIEVRGWETFPNLFEYQIGLMLGSEQNTTDIDVNDTDHDGMPDGWEAYLGVEDWAGSGEWRLDPSSDHDRYQDPDGDLVETRWSIVQWLWEDPDGDGVYEPPGGATPFDTAPVGHNLHEYMVGTDPFDADTDDDSYPLDSGVMDDFNEVVYHLTDPVSADTDTDGMHDGYEVYYMLQVLNSSDGFNDDDSDGLTNLGEWQHDTNPHKNDTDDDLMQDGWEVDHGFDPTDPGDANMDADGDELLNWQEFLNGTDPLDTDTDGDRLSDYAEVVMGWFLDLNGTLIHYYTDPNNADTDGDDHEDDEDGDGNTDCTEEFLDEKDDDGDVNILQNNGIDDDRDGVVDDGRAGIPAVGEPEGVDEEHDLNDWNEVYIYKTLANNPDTDGDGKDDWDELFG
jgi:hypothetical protein